MRRWLSPPLLALHALALVAVAVCVAGGFWQLGSYESKQDAERTSQAAPVPITDVWKPGEAFPGDLLHRSVTVEGRFESADTQFWAQSPMSTEGRAWLVAPFDVEGSGAALLVVRGVADEPGRSLPAVPGGRQQLRVTLAPSDAGGQPLDERRVTTAVSVPIMLNELPVRLWSGYGVSEIATGSGLALVEAPGPDVSWTVGLRNLAYSLQWWVFGLFALFMWWRMCTEQLEQGDSPEGSDEHPVGPEPSDTLTR